MEREKARMNPVVLDWNWKYQSEFMVFSIYGSSTEII